MAQADYEEQNRVKASFDAAYTAPTPHRYLRNMAAVDYRMADYMNPFLSAVVDASATSAEPVRVLDLGCSYGLSAALLKTNCEYDELVQFYRRNTSSEFSACVAASRRWLRSHKVRDDVKVVGFDSSREAVRFSAASSMIDEGIARNLEEGESGLTGDEASLVRNCDVLLSTGAIGYVTERTVEPILDEFGNNCCGRLGPVALMSVLELFDPQPIRDVFADHGFRFEELPVRLPQRRFADESEREGVLETMRQRGLPTRVLEGENKMFASLCVAAQPRDFGALVQCVAEVTGELHQVSMG